MARDITTGFQTEIEADSLQPILLVKAEFDEGDVNFWTGFGDLVFDGDTYNGAGNLLAVTQVQETQELKANNVTFQLTGLPSSIIAIALDTNYQGRPITLFFGALDSDFNLVVDPYQLFSGKMDTMRINDNGDTATIDILSESDLIDLRNRNDSKYTPENQKINFPNDTGLDFVPTIQEVEIIW